MRRHKINLDVLLNEHSLLEFRLLISSISMVIYGRSNLHTDQQHWLNDFSQCDIDRLIKLANIHSVIVWLAQYSKALSTYDLTLTDTVKSNLKIISNHNKVYAFNSACQQTVAKEITAHLQQHQVNTCHEEKSSLYWRAEIQQSLK